MNYASAGLLRKRAAGGMKKVVRRCRMQLTLPAEIRERTGKGPARNFRNQKKIPAVLYGPKTGTILLTVNDADLRRALKTTGGENLILTLQIASDKENQNRMVMLKELQRDLLKPNFLHADFLEISVDTLLTVNIPLHLKNTPVGLSMGGILEHVKREITVSCLPGKLVDFIEVDVSGLNMGEAVHIKDINLPEGMKAEEEGHLTVAVVTAPSGPRPKSEEEEPVAEEAKEEA
jgi:large subunit ribosomal protein L25